MSKRMRSKLCRIDSAAPGFRTFTTTWTRWPSRSISARWHCAIDAEAKGVRSKLRKHSPIGALRSRATIFSTSSNGMGRVASCSCLSALTIRFSSSFALRPESMGSMKVCTTFVKNGPMFSTHSLTSSAASSASGPPFPARDPAMRARTRFIVTSPSWVMSWRISSMAVRVDAPLKKSIWHRRSISIRKKNRTTSRCASSRSAWAGSLSCRTTRSSIVPTLAAVAAQGGLPSRRRSISSPALSRRSWKKVSRLLASSAESSVRVRSPS